MRRAGGPRTVKWLAGVAVLALAVVLLRRRGRIFLAAVSGALTDRALRALAETFRDEEPRAAGQSRG